MKNSIIFLFLLMPFGLFAQTTVRGVVTDTKGESLIGASVVEVANLSNGASTGMNGEFTLTLKTAAAKIKVSYLGFKTLTLTPTSGNMSIQLEEDETMLQEVEIVRMGFGTKSRMSNVAAISQINASQIRAIPTTSIQNALAGRLPGLFQLQGSGQPGDDAAELFIRGIGTFATDVDLGPLILIDDIESDRSTLSRLSPNDIEDISILKDAGSTAIFGIKGANGVILITTRRGKEGKPRLTFRADIGFQQPTYTNQFLNSYESLSLLKELHLNEGNTTALGAERYYSDSALEHYRLQDDPYRYPDVDWYNLVYKKSSLQQQYTADVQGGTEKVKYFISLSYIDQGGLFKDLPKQENFDNDYYLKRYNVRSNFDIKVTKDFLVKLNANAVLSEINEPNMPNTRVGDTNFFKRILGGAIAPYHYPAYNPDGSFGGYTGTAINPLALLAYGGYKRQFRNNLNGNITLEHKLDFITEGLKARGVMALTNNWGWRRELTRSEVLDYSYDTETEKYIPVITNQYLLPLLGASHYNYAPFTQINSRIDLAYYRRIGAHGIDALLLGNWYTKREGSGNQRNSISYSGRIGYDYDTRYILELSGTYNGSDAFMKDNRYDFFPAVSLGWNLASEPYLENFMGAAKINTLKLRGSFGYSGSDQMPGNKYAYEESYDRVMNYYFGETATGIDAWALIMYPNPKVKWETDRKLDLGVDLRLFNDRFAASVDYFFNKRSDILAQRAGIVYYAGYLNVFYQDHLQNLLPPMNLGRTENKGWDGELSWRDQINKDLSYYVRGTFSHAENKIIDMDEAPSEYALSMQTGRPIGTIFGYVADGFYNSQEEIKAGPYNHNRDVKPGDLKYKDISGPNGAPDGIINDYDRVAIGNTVPDVTYGISLGFSYKNFDFSTLFQGATGASINIENMLRLASGSNTITGSEGRPMPIHQGRWTYYDTEGNLISDPVQLAEMNKNASYPRLAADNGLNNAVSTFWQRSADYLRWKNIEIGYNLPEAWFASKFGISSVRLYFTAQNLYTWSGLKEYQVDPESTKSGLLTYPQQRVYNFGCQISF